MTLYSIETIEIANRLYMNYYGSAVRTAIQDGHDLDVAKCLVERGRSPLEESHSWRTWDAVNVAFQCGRVDALAWLIDEKKLPYDGDDALIRLALQNEQYEVLIWAMQRPAKTLTWEQVIDIFIDSHPTVTFLDFFKKCAPFILRAKNAVKVFIYGQQTILFSETQAVKRSYQQFLQSLEQYLVEGDEPIAELISQNSGATFYEDNDHQYPCQESVVNEAEALFAQHGNASVVFAVKNDVSMDVIQYLFYFKDCPLLGQDINSDQAAIDFRRMDVLGWLVRIGFDKETLLHHVILKLSDQAIDEPAFNEWAIFLCELDRKNKLVEVMQDNINSNQPYKDVWAIRMAERLLAGDIELIEPNSPLLCMWPASHVMHRAMQGYYLVKDIDDPASEQMNAEGVPSKPKISIAGSLRRIFESILAGNILACAPADYQNGMNGWSAESAQLFIHYALFKDCPLDAEMQAIVWQGMAQQLEPAPEVAPSLKRPLESDLPSDDLTQTRKSTRIRKPANRWYGTTYSPAHFSAKPSQATSSSSISSLQKRQGK